MKRFQIPIPPRLQRPSVVAFAILALASSPAYAAMNLQQGAVTLGTALLIVFGVLVLVAAAIKGVEVVNNHSSVTPVLVGLVIGLSLVFGGAWYLTELGANAGAAGIDL